ncbi:AAA family ATPase [Klebsiella quasipneumoniae subsp. similipneumoniae]|uniref:AAA family ATPase n=1 Tax=Klebsiella quasipneumoniae TaxID=1463165 RepID=UPI0013FE12A9|nr:AAA family ATPase [Klebsiella quasipneumoniae]NHJ30492.1 AAA family ATPase [Klebsiella quasipneumoniae subsp. similipneumoniae]NHJ51145.1 AAA family ATPase [Klebsiella quasipneumoniae subsp. similipneumoniae]NHJ68973.1 AAA family ATPase [Klebsiella quasipneumoniae subsp. similipneumoniae]NHJ73511.1 AAA family ATPase [Klebsiella quasipneumoniae subsp. similipneumoniae]NHJ83383.1 AAA family ATPase [Klebsiella quasipneumoniae subsp. similipneumoniae]
MSSIIKKINIDGFKSILNETIEFGQLNVFIGTNGAGKSNLLESIAMVSASIEGGIDYDRLARRGARLSAPEIFRSSFKNKKRKALFRIEVETNEYNYSMGISPKEGFSYHSESLVRRSDERCVAGRSNKGAKIDGIPLPTRVDKESSIISLYNTVHADFDDMTGIKNYAIYSPSTPILRGVSNDGSNKAPLGLYGGRLAEALKEILSNTEKRSRHLDELLIFFKLIDWMQSINTTSEIDSKLASEHISLGRNVLKYKDKYMKTNFNDIYAYDVSEGALYVLFTLLLLIHEDSPDIVAIDNIDSALNPGLIRTLMSQVSDIIKKKKNKQIFMTTHNPITLDGIDLFNDDHRLFVVERDKEGLTRVKRISPPPGMTKEQWENEYYGMKLSEIWLSGAIGGIPYGFA